MFKNCKLKMILSTCFNIIFLFNTIFPLLDVQNIFTRAKWYKIHLVFELKFKDEAIS